MNQTKPKTVATFLCHLEDTRDKVYRHAESESCLVALCDIENMSPLNFDTRDDINDGQVSQAQQPYLNPTN